MTSLVSSVYATNIGPYIGIQSGYSWLDDSTFDLFGSNFFNENSSDGVSGDIHGGYLFSLTQNISFMSRDWSWN